MPCASLKPLPPNRWRCAPELQASAAGRELASALANLAERAPHIVDADANAAAPLLDAAWAAYLDAQRNPPSIDALRAAAADHLCAAKGDIHFTAGGTEADILALLGTLCPGDKVVTSPIEHAALAQMMDYLQQHFGIEVVRLPLEKSGVISASAIDRCIMPGTKLVVCMAANNETGVVQPLLPIAERCQRVGAILHVDAVQAFGRMPHRAFLSLPGKTMVALAGHKLGATGHTGLLCARGVTLDDAFGLRALAPLVDASNVCGFASFVAALADAEREDGRHVLRNLRDDLEQRILAMGYGAQVIGVGHERLNNTSCIFWPGIEAEAILMALDARDIAIGAGSACSSGSTEASPTLLAMGMTPFDARCCVRLSFHRSTSARDVDGLVCALEELLPRLSACSRDGAC